MTFYGKTVYYKYRTLTVFLWLFWLSPLSWSESPKVYIIGVEGLSYYPHYSFDREYGYQGVYKEILDLFAAKNGYSFTYSAMPVDRLYEALLVHKTVDFKYPDHPLWKAPLKQPYKVVYSEPMVNFTDGLMVLPENKGKGLDGLSMLGIPRGFTPVGYEQFIANGTIKLHDNPSFGALLRMAVKGRLDGIYINVHVARHHLKTRLFLPGGLVFDDSLPYVSDSYRFATVKHPKVMKEFDKFLSEEKAKIELIKRRFDIE